MPVVVVGYVPEPEGGAALIRAIHEARLRGADLILVDSHRATDAEGQPDLGAAAATLASSGVSYEVRRPAPGSEAVADLIGVAEAHDADLIVIGLRRRSPVGKLALGAQAQRVLLDAGCAVLAVKAP